MRREAPAHPTTGTLDAPRRSRLLSILSRRPFRRFFGPAERALRARLAAPLADLVAADPELKLIYHDEQMWVGRRTVGMTSRTARRRNIELVEQILASAGIASFAIPDQSRRHAALGVAAEDWTRFVGALQSFNSAAPVYAGLVARLPNGGTTRLPFLAASAEVAQALTTQQSVPVFQFFAEAGKDFPFGLGDACEVQRWERATDGTLETEVKNNRTSAISRAEQISATVEVNQLPLPTFAPLAEQNVFEINEPIDAVFMWVDGQDAAWRTKRDAVIAELTGTVPSDSFDASRFRDNGELRYSFRSLFEHCDWIRNIILVSDSQIPEWLDVSHPRIRVVDHQELFADTGALPTFNSHAIASRIHHIDGLSERYLIMNDDVFVGHSIGPEKFFLSNGMSRFFLSQSTLPRREKYDQAHESARDNVARLIQDTYGATVGRIFWHTPVPQQKSLLLELEQEHPEAFTATWSHQLRSPEDFEINGWMHHYVGYLKRRTLPGSIRYDYFNLGAENLIPRLDALMRSRSISTFCLNDSPDAPERNLEYVGDWLERYFPVAAPWELDRK